ncbi:hypothetical protein OPT61_g3264 [Boeremia exigua]|uniref:Uncharacterized protein n=1 Tax=Boeremia exigua TaxID=749465 RepID=A0ACC2IIJ1_9PLEO|nr:hypothetical protein OPT61_g3264 [Boeremia exigua]
MSRTTTGCVTCRVRRVKCDEGRPSCLKCLSTQRTCDGYIEGTIKRSKPPKAVVPTQRLRPPMLMPKVYTWHEGRDAQIFDYFRSRTVTGTRSLFEAKFWNSLLLERAHHEQQIKHIVLALGALHHYHESGDESVQNYGLCQYNKAIQYTQQAIERTKDGNGDMNNILIAVILFHCLENVMGNFSAAQTHLAAGMRLLRGQDLGAIEKTTLDTMHRLEFHAWTMSDDSAPYDLDPSLAPEFLEVDHFSDIETATSTLISLLKYTMLISVNPIESPDGQTLALKREQCRIVMIKWRENFDRLQFDFRVACVAGHVLDMYYTLNWLILTCYSAGEERAWDRDLTSWTHIIATDEWLSGHMKNHGATSGTSSFSLEMGLIVPMFMTANEVQRSSSAQKSYSNSGEPQMEGGRLGKFWNCSPA